MTTEQEHCDQTDISLLERRQVEDVIRILDSCANLLRSWDRSDQAAALSGLAIDLSDELATS